ncbi:MAG: Verru_Chthon cassette protein B [Verrucomicrobiales bacterium]|nr:Verru_Chthon cassette protein B [Verrucomicrobiales bacterium]
MKFSTSDRQRGFSLVEVTVALGICATGILLTVAMLPSILNSVGESVDRNAYARIKQSLSSQYAMMDWEILEENSRNNTSDRYYFDFDGTEVPRDSFEAAYAAQIRVGDRRTLSGDDRHNRFIRFLEIRITRDIEDDKAFEDPERYDQLTTSLGNEAKLEEQYRD